MTIKEAKPRSQTPEADTWDLTSIYQDDDQARQEMANLADLLADFQGYQGQLSQGKDQVLAALADLAKLSRQLEKVYVYAHLKHDQDTTNEDYLQLDASAQSLAAQVAEQLAWFTPELLALDQDLLNDLAQVPGYEHYFDTLLRQKNHILPADQEALLAGASEIFNNPSQTFSMLNNADLKFGSVTIDGRPVDLTHGSYGVMLESKDREVRRTAFNQLYQHYDQVKYTLAATMSGNIKSHNYLAKVYGFASARERALFQNNIPLAVYDELVATVNDNLHLLHDFVAYRKDQLGLDEVEMYDMYTPLAGQAPLKYSFEEAKEVVLAALAPLGDQYINDLKQAFDQRWIDVYENIGKRSGAYSSGAYDTNPYILLNWQDSLNDLYTLVHELGHSMHSYYTRKNQDYIYGDYSIFVAEVASTTNENLLTEYLLNTVKDKDAQIYILNHYLDGVKGTVFRQTQFAEFEQFMHESEAKGQALTADYLTNHYESLNRKYYGPSLSNDETIGLEWARIPHFYMNYYVYQYATGFCAATALAERILGEDGSAVNDYLAFLAAGSSDYPIKVMQQAGVDMTNPNYIQATMNKFEARFSQLRTLLAK
ncbi:oligopeptidase PepB [Aerococcus urinaehominis]|uniref:Oligopeptidase F n=1 Tax=Aerococcus urinaehominis TaxID=128944 RepID=A0A0X8FLR5_9LACT|nr:oligoendopeptidase F [Aerococcus urinaehominis]AMB99630.1 oligopeptidase PepB [Aerococcus urinaehominis]SDL88037.1 oligoendopeptidase F [Aerococcus urinaehominis]